MREWEDWILALIAIAGLLLLIFVTPDLDKKVKALEEENKHLQTKVSLLQEKCSDYGFLTERLNQIEVEQNHQKEVIETIDWATKYRY